MGDIQLGCSGWDYDEWIGPFYQTRSGSKLRAYAEVFGTAEINSTFYRAPTEGMVLGWAKYSPEDFLFAAKVPQTVTHDRLLKVEAGAGEDLRSFTRLMAPLLEVGKLGALLLQLPPSLKFYEDRTKSFLETLPGEYPFAIEFRHESWMRPEAFDLLREHGVAYSVVDEPLLPPEVRITSSLAYVRWHGHGRDPWYNYRYSQEELKPWVPQLQKMAGEAKTVLGYFNNHFHGYAPENCLEVLEMLGVLTADQRRTLTRIKEFREGIVRAAHGKVKATTLEDFSPEGAPTRGGEYLAELTTRARMERARRIESSQMEIASQERLVRGRVGSYTVIIDQRQGTISHDCEDWRKNLSTGILCKHVVAILLALPKERGAALVEELYSNRDEWTFEGEIT